MDCKQHQQLEFRQGNRNSHGKCHDADHILTKSATVRENQQRSREMSRQFSQTILNCVFILAALPSLVKQALLF